MADFYYRYTNKSSNLLLNDAYLASTIPVTNGLHRRFKAEDFNGTTKVWTDSALGNTITATGNVTLVSRTGNSQYRTTKAVAFDTTAAINFNNDLLSTYTVFTVTKWVGPSAGRIIQCMTDNWLSGHWNGMSGVAFHVGWLTTPQVDLHPSNFFIGTDVATKYHTNGVLRGTNLSVRTSLPSTGINQGTNFASESSEGQLLDFLIYNRELSDLEKKKVEQYLASYYGLMDTVGNLTATYNRTQTATENAMLVSTTASPNWIVYPTFYIAQTGLTFAMWFQANGTADQSRLFDFGNDAGANQTDNIKVTIIGNRLRITVYSGPGIRYCDAFNLYTDCNDNVWRHFIWTISADGGTWKVYINKVLQTTINSSNYTSYTNYTNPIVTSPTHPASVMRTLNYIGKSAWSGDAALNGSVEDFQMYNYPLEQIDINNTWNMDTNGSLIPKYFRTPLSTETSLLVSSSTNRNYIIYPAIYTGSSGISFGLWFKANSTATWSRMFDFGTGNTGSQLNSFAMYINAGNIGIISMAKPVSGFYCQLQNLYPSVNNNVWTHVVWSISADGGTWNLYINKTLVRTVNSTNYTSYSPQAGSVAPFYPSNTIQTNNYLCYSNNLGDNASIVPNMSIHAFQVWGSEISQSTVNSLYTTALDASNDRYTLSNFSNISKYVNDVPFTLSTPTSTGSGLFSFKSSNPAVAKIINDVVTILTPGTTTITASQWTSTISSTLTVSNPVPTFGSFTVSSLPFGSAPFTITPPTSNSTGAFTYTSSNTSVATVSGNVITVVGGGSTTITAIQASSASYSQGTTTATFTVTQITPTFGSFIISSLPAGSSPFTITPPTSNSSGAFTYTSSNTSVATVSGNVITVVGGGSTTVTATQASTTNYLQGVTTATFTVTLLTPTLGTFIISSLPAGSSPFTITPPTSNSSGAFTYTSSNTSVATLSGNVVTVVGIGSTTITATQAATTTYTQATTPATFTVFAQITPTFGTFTVSYTGSSPFTITPPTSNSSGAFTYTSSNTSVATLSGNVVTVIGMGTTTITATQAAATTYTQGSTSATLSILTPVAPILGTFTLQNKTSRSSPFKITPPTSNSSGAFTYTSSTTSVATVSGNVVTIVGLGTTTITATQAATTSYLQVTMTATFTVTSSLIAYLSVNIDVGKLVVPIEGSSFVSSNPTVATVSRTTITLLNCGTTTLTSNLHSSSNPLQLVLTVTRNGTGFISGQKDLIETIDQNSIQTITVNPVTTCQTLALSYKQPVYKKNLQVTLDGVSNLGDTTLTFGKTKPNLWVAIGSGTNTMAYSSDGINWTGLGTSIFSQGRGLAYNGRIWVAGGDGGTTTLGYSYDAINWTGLGNTIFNTGAYDFAWNGRIWVAAGGNSGTNTLAYSYDGITWKGLGAPINTWINSVAYNGKMFVAVGNGTVNMIYSYDGINWVANNSSLFSQGGCVRWNGTMWVVGGAVNTSSTYIAYSYDGINWTSVANSKTLINHTNGLIGVAWNGTLWVGACGGTGCTNSLIYSYDGITWNGLGTSIFTNYPYSITWNGQMFMACGIGSNSMAYSYDGLRWTGLGTSLFSIICYAAVNNVAYENSITIRKRMMIAGGEGPNTLAYSYDGVTWTGLGNSIFSLRCYCIRWNGTMWVATGYSTNNFAYSYDGIKWFSDTANNIMGLGICIAWNGTMWTAGGVSGVSSFSLASSSDGKTWTGRDKTTISGTCYGIATNGKRWVALGDGTNSIAYSDTGTTWTGLGTTIFTTGMCVSWNGTMFVAGGSGNNQLAYSYDGLVWVGLGNIFTTTPHDIVNNGTMWVVVGGQKGAYSYDGKTWTLYDLPFFTGIQYAGAMYVSWNGSLWVVVGGSGTSQMAYSSDGINWTTNPNKIFTNWGTGVGTDWAGESTSIQLYQTHVACGSGTNTLAYSNDGISWTGLGTTIFTGSGDRAAWNGSMWVAGGRGTTNTMAYSYDGKNWIGLGNSIFNSTCEALYWNGTFWLAGGYSSDSNTMAYSYDGINWIGKGRTIFTGACYGYAYNGTLYVAVGYGTNCMAYSSDGFNWTANTTTTFSVFDSIVWSGTLWVASGGGGVAYSYDGITWSIVASILVTSPNFRGQCLAYNGSMFVVVGGSSIIYYSYDGINWTQVVTGFTSGITRGVIWTGTLWLLFSESTTNIPFSYDGKTWIENRPSIFTTGVNCGVADGRLDSTLNIATDSYYQNGYKSITFATNQTS